MSKQTITLTLNENGIYEPNDRPKIMDMFKQLKASCNQKIIEQRNLRKAQEAFNDLNK